MSIKVSNLYDIILFVTEDSREFGESIVDQCKNQFGIDVMLHSHSNDTKEEVYENLQTWKSEDQMNDPWTWPFVIVRRLDVSGAKFHWGEQQINEVIASLEA